MIRAGFAALVLLAACGPTNATYRDLDRIGADYARAGASPIAADTCHIADHRNLIGLNERAVDGANLPAGTRVLCFGCATPRMDTPARLNVQIGADHTVASLHCG